jgi:hypothetical protein
MMDSQALFLAMSVSVVTHLSSPSENRFESPAHVPKPDRTEVARVPTPPVVESEEPYFTGRYPVLAPGHMSEGTARTVM